MDYVAWLECRGRSVGRSARALTSTTDCLPTYAPHNNSRLSVKFPEITAMQVRAIITAALEAQAKGATVMVRTYDRMINTRLSVRLCATLLTSYPTTCH